MGDVRGRTQSFGNHADWEEGAGELQATSEARYERRRVPLLFADDPERDDQDDDDESVEPELNAAEKGGKLTFAEALFTSLNYNLGLGMLCFAYNLHLSGWSGLVVLLGTFVICWITAQMLGKMMARFPGIHSYADIAHRATVRSFSRSSYVPTVCMTSLRGFQVLELFSYLLLSAVTMQQALLHIPGIGGVDNLYLTWALIGSCAWLLDPKHLSFFSIGGIATMLALYAVLLLGAVHQIYSTREVHLSLPLISSDFLDFGAAFGGIVVMFAGHAVFPSIFETLADKSDYARVVNYTFAILVFLTLGLGVALVAAFGDQVEELPTACLPSGSTLNLVGQVLLALRCFFTFPLIRYPVVVEVSHLIRRLRQDEDDAEGAALGYSVLRDQEVSLSVPMSYSPFIALTGQSMASIRTVMDGHIVREDQAQGVTKLNLVIGLVIMVAALAISSGIDSLAFILSFVGSTFAVSLAITFPALCFARLIKVGEGFMRSCAWPMVFFGLVSMTISFTATVR